MSLLTHQPRWLLLSIFLVLWSWSSGLRRDSYRPKALGLGTEAHLLSSEDTWEEKRQTGMAPCVERCAMEAGKTIGCGDTLNFACVCHSPQFMPDAVDCMTANCSAEDKAAGQALLMAACRHIGTSVSLPISFSVIHTSITSGVPPIFSTSSPASGSTQATVTVTVTAPPSSSSGSDPAPSTHPVSRATTSSSVPSSTSSASPPPSAPPASGLPSAPPNRPETTVLETSTVSVPPTPTGASAGENGASAVQAAAAFPSGAAAVLAALVGMAFVL